MTSPQAQCPFSSVAADAVIIDAVNTILIHHPHCSQGITSETLLIQNLQPTGSNPQRACQPTDASVFLQARVQAVDGGETGQECEEKPSSSVLQSGDGGHKSPTWDQLPGRLQRGRPEVHRAASGGAHHPICQHLHTTCCRPPARPHRPAGRQHTEPLRPPAEHPTREGWDQRNDQGRGKQCCVAAKTYPTSSEFNEVTGGAAGLNCSTLPLKVIFTPLPGGSLLLGRLRKVIQHSVPKQLKVTQLFKTGHVLR